MERRRLYVLDANVFIQARRRYYAFDICPGFWDSLLAYHDQGNVLSIDRIEGELRSFEGGDEIIDWMENAIPPSFFVSTGEPDTIASYSQIIDWVNEQPRIFQAAKDDFARGADGWLIAYAHAKDSIVVTHESARRPNAQNKVLIPNVCHAFGIGCVNTFEMLRALGVSFICDDDDPVPF